MEVDEFLEHYGVLGMHWGVRKDRPSGGTRIRTQRTFTGYYGSNNKNSLKGVGLNLMSYLGGFPLAAGATSVISPMSLVYHTSRREIKHSVKKINQKYTAPGHDIRTDKKLQGSYNKDVQQAIHTAINRQKSAWVRPLRAVANVRAGKHINTEYDVDFYMTDSWNKAAFIVLTSPKGQKKDLRVGFAKHSDDQEDDPSVLHLEVALPRDENGLITDFIIPDLEDKPDNMVNHADSVENFLEHYGILGMHWGVRRSRAQLSRAGAGPSGRPAWQSPPPPRQPAPSPPASRSPKLGRLSREKTPPSQDALEIHALRQKVKKHGMSSLTNEDLQKIARRAELQQKYNTAFPKKPSKKSIAAKLAVEYALSTEGSKAITTLATTKLSNPHAANKIYDIFKPGGPASQVNQARKLANQGKKKK